MKACPKKYPQYLPQNIPKTYLFIFLKTPINIEIQNFEPKRTTLAYVCMKILDYPPPPPPDTVKLAKPVKAFKLQLNILWCEQGLKHD